MQRAHAVDRRDDARIYRQKFVAIAHAARSRSTRQAL
jgi:hypothetical protein